jgi:hypothetical protein
MAAIKLNQFAETRPPLPPAAALFPSPPADPQPFRCQPSSQSAFADTYPVRLSQFLSRERGSEIAILLQLCPLVTLFVPSVISRPFGSPDLILPNVTLSLRFNNFDFF